jgi:L-Ala-D/L-Glu epimerase
MLLDFQPYDLRFKHAFAIANFSRTFTRIVLTEIKLEGHTGYGEASIPAYLGETADSSMAFLEQAKAVLKNQKYPFDINAIMGEIEALAEGNKAAKAAVDIALHDLKGKIENSPVWKFLGVNKKTMPITSITLGIDTPSVLRQKVEEALDFKVLKIKLGSDDDKKIIESIREMTDKPLYVDANQGWKDKHFALDMAHWLAEKGVKLIEQPMPKENLDGNTFVTEGSPIPTFADESFQRLTDLPKIKGAFHGVNIKLMKCTGINEGLKIIQAARHNEMQILIGCMSETSCGIMAGASLAPLCDFVDLDGPWLSANNPFKTPKLKEGKIQLNNTAGFGLVKLKPKN